jgi:hypothetical protein
VKSKSLVAGMRGALAALSKVATKEHQLEPTEEVVPGTAFRIKTTTNQYPEGTVGFFYGDSRLVVGPRIGEPIALDNASEVEPASEAQIDKAAAELSDKRVCSLLRNMVVAIHQTFPSQTITAGE